MGATVKAIRRITNAWVRGSARMDCARGIGIGRRTAAMVLMLAPFEVALTRLRPATAIPYPGKTCTRAVAKTA
jgi:hypothetical protein